MTQLTHQEKVLNVQRYNALRGKGTVAERVAKIYNHYGDRMFLTGGWMFPDPIWVKTVHGLGETKKIVYINDEDDLIYTAGRVYPDGSCWNTSTFQPNEYAIEIDDE
jgi:hypothetical protein